MNDYLLLLGAIWSGGSLLIFAMTHEIDIRKPDNPVSSIALFSFIIGIIILTWGWGLE